MCFPWIYPDLKATAHNPNPTNYKFVKVAEHNGYLVVKINYPDCNNYEGNKIMVYKDVDLLTLINNHFVDPHFFS